MAGRIAVVLKGYPRLSETFIAQELLGLEKRGHNLVLYSMRQPRDAKTHPVHDEIAELFDQMRSKLENPYR